MKHILQILMVPILVWSALIQPAAAESRGKSLKRAEKELRRANFIEAEKIYRRLLEISSDDKEARLGLSFSLVKLNKYQESYEHAAMVLATDPINARAHALLGTSLLRSGEFRVSIESLFTAVKFDKREALAVAGLAEVEYYENRSRNAYDGLKRAIQLDPTEPDYWIALARACSRLEYYGEAADAYQRFLEISPKTDAERRARIQGLIAFYRYLGTTKIHRLGGSEVTSLPFDLINDRPFVNVMINGKGPMRFVIDSAAGISVISEKTAASLGVSPVARGGSARAIGGAFPIVYGLLDSITIGEAKIEAVPVYIRTVHSEPETPDEARSDGYLGLSALGNFAVTLDYQEKRLTLDQSPIRNDDQTKKTGDSGGVEIPIRNTSGGLASVETYLPSVDRPFNFIIDTASTACVVSKTIVARHQLEGLKLKGASTRVIGAAGIVEGVESLGLATLAVNGLTKKNTQALILDLDSINGESGFEQHGILGGTYLSHFRIVL
ncbi:MAG TPA: aspartyl protease family protein, partial [Blastocatellia bacterium]|nr:aspartyl protease family protein [Blastocatellia bacterium]